MTWFWDIAQVQLSYIFAPSTLFNGSSPSGITKLIWFNSLIEKAVVSVLFVVQWRPWVGRGGKGALQLGAQKYQAHIETCIVVDFPPPRALLWLILQLFHKESTPGSQRVWKSSFLPSPFRHHVSSHPTLPSIFRGFWGYRNAVWLPLDPKEHLLPFISAGSISSISLSLSCHSSTLSQPPLLSHTEVLHPCGRCPFLGQPPPCFCKTRKVGPETPLCPRQVPVHIIPKHLWASRVESSALIDKTQSRSLKSNSRPAYGTRNACFTKGCSSQGARVNPVPRKELLWYWRDK